MSLAFRLSLTQPSLSGTIVLEPSKSISNRVLIIKSLCEDDFQIHRLSQSDDTVALLKMLSTESNILYSGHAGSSYRFMVARACLMDKPVKLDASEQLRRRPIGPLVNALRLLGADISYGYKEGFPPLLINPSEDFGKKRNEINLQAGISSQYVSALLLIAPQLSNGLTIHLTEDPVSIPYIRMTLDVMKWFGTDHVWNANTITVPPGKYKGRDFTVEGDWSAASYYYSMAALAQAASVQIDGLSENSLQGDAVVREMYKPFGIETDFNENGIRITKKENTPRLKEFAYNFSDHPDLAQTMMVTLSALGVKGNLSGLKTLRIKETDRISAMQTELAKVKTTLEVHEKDGDISCVLFGKAKWKDKAKFNTYGDHRMAMSLSPFACLNPIIIRQPDVVSKSYPGFWKDLGKLGFTIERINEKSK